MILGVSHIVLGSTDLTRDRRLFEGLGWTTEFEQRGIPTHPGKLPFMSTRSQEQGLVFLQPPTGTPVELIHYADSLPDTSESPLQIVLPRPDAIAAFRRLADVPFHPGATAYELPHVTCPLWFARPAPRPSLIVHHVTDMEVGRRFWQQGLGFRPIGSSGSAPSGAMAFEFRSLVPHWCATVLLARREGPITPGVLDGPGFRCLSVVTSDRRRVADRVVEAGATASTGPLELVVNDKALHLEILQGPDGLFVEVLRIRS